MEQAKQGGNETAPEMAGYYRGAGCFSLKAAELNELLGVGRCFDMTGRDLSIGGRQARLWVVNGYAQEDMLERVIAGGQALAQKNIILPMWLTFQYLDPIASVSLAAYSIFQNIVNATQIWLKGRRDDRILRRLHDYHEKKHALLRASEEAASLLAVVPSRVKNELKK